MREVPVFDDSAEGTHDPGHDPTFQESAVYVWHDEAAGVGGFWRLGQEPNVQKLNSCFGVFTHEGDRFRSNVTGVPMAASDRSERHMGWGEGGLRLDLERQEVTANLPECEVQLRFEDFYPRYDHIALINIPVPASAYGHHFEVAGRMRGRVRIGAREIEVNALGYRDRSWGPRTWGTLRGTRWWPAVFGPDLTVATIAMVDETGRHGCFGYMVRDGVAHSIREAEVLVTLDHDAVSPRGAYTRFTLENGEMGELHHEPADGILLHVRGFSAVESIGTVRWGDRRGMSNIEVCTNPTGGVLPPAVTLGANSGEGLSRR